MFLLRLPTTSEVEFAIELGYRQKYLRFYYRFSHNYFKKKILQFSNLINFNFNQLYQLVKAINELIMLKD